MEEKNTISQPIYATGHNMKIDVRQKLADMMSPHQHIMFIDTEKFGRCLVIDDVIQTAESDHSVYDLEMLAKMKDTDRDILILGGGDGYIAQMAIEKNAHMNVTIADLDAMVVEGCKKYLDQTVFDDERVNVVIGDALAYMHDGDKKYDGIVSDLTDAPVGAEDVDAFRDFFAEVIDHAYSCMKDGAWMSFQAGASEVSGAYINSVEIIQGMLAERFGNVERTDVMIPSYGEKCAFLFVEK